MRERIYLTSPYPLQPAMPPKHNSRSSPSQFPHPPMTGTMGTPSVSVVHLKYQSAQLGRCAPTCEGNVLSQALCSPSPLLTRRLCLHYLCSSLTHLGYDPEHFITHSFRIGAAITAAHEGARQSTINTSMEE